MLFDMVWLYGGRLLILLSFAGVWWAAVRIGWLDRFFFSSPDDIVRFLAETFVSEIIPNALETLLAMLVGFALSSIAGVAAGLLLFELPGVKRMIDPFLTALNSMPRIALAPIFILWFGIGMSSKVALAFSLGFFIVLLSTHAGIRNVDPTLIRLSRSLGCSARQQFLNHPQRLRRPQAGVDLFVPRRCHQRNAGIEDRTRPTHYVLLRPVAHGCRARHPAGDGSRRRHPHRHRRLDRSRLARWLDLSRPI
jgi:ABC-type nitrate/sulfonate/bicarbonate transport system permease component